MGIKNSIFKKICFSERIKSGKKKNSEIKGKFKNVERKEIYKEAEGK